MLKVYLRIWEFSNPYFAFIHANMVLIEPDDIRIGDHVAVRIDPRSEDFVLVWADPFDTSSTSRKRQSE